MSDERDGYTSYLEEQLQKEREAREQTLPVLVEEVNRQSLQLHRGFTGVNLSVDRLDRENTARKEETAALWLEMLAMREELRTVREENTALRARLAATEDASDGEAAARDKIREGLLALRNGVLAALEEVSDVTAVVAELVGQDGKAGAAQ